MRLRRWEELPKELLVEIFGQVDMDFLAKTISFVCKSWYKASLAPQLWQIINLFDLQSDPDESDSCLEAGFKINPRWIAKDKQQYIKLEEIDIVNAYIRFLVHRSHHFATTVLLPQCWQLEQQTLDCIAEGCPSLKLLTIVMDNDYNNIQLSGLICQWKNLETLQIGRNFDLECIIPQISIHCRNFVNLRVLGGTICCSAASAIATLPNLKILYLEGLEITQENLVILLNGCDQLKYLEVSGCTGFDADDDEILELASHINVFECNHSVGYDSSKDEDDALRTFMTCFGFSFSGVS